MKRKRSQDLAVAHDRQKIAKQCTSRPPKSTDMAQPCSLLRIIREYGLLESIVSNFTPEDLFSLAATSKAMYAFIFPCKASTSNILSKLPCSGKGVTIRRLIHQKSSASNGPRSVHYDVCGTNTSRDVESRQCFKCKLTTCDECRIHLVFNSTIEPADEPDELPTYSGFALLSPLDMGILTPAHLNLSAPTTIAPYHDQGFLDIPWTATEDADLESINEILDFNLGERPLQLAEDSNSDRNPSSVIQAFWEYTEERKLRLCIECEKVQEMGDWHPRSGGHECRCTLRKRILGRWMCIDCFQKESETTRDITRAQMNFKYPKPGVRRSLCFRCTCGAWFNGPDGPNVCLWCHGNIPETTKISGD